MPSKGQYRLIVRQGPVPGKIYELVKDVTTLGRDVRNDLVVNDAEVSRSHARLTTQADGPLVEDLASTNGTFINGQRLTVPKVLRPHDMLGLGETVVMELEFVPEAQATVIGTPPSEAEPSRPASTAPLGSSQAAAPTAVEAPKPSQSPRWVAVGCGLISVCLCCSALVAAAWYIDANNLYCQIAPFLFGACP